MIEATDLSFPGSQYSIGNLEAPDPILMVWERDSRYCITNDFNDCGFRVRPGHELGENPL